MANLQWSEPKVLISKKQLDRILNGQSQPQQNVTSDVAVQQKDANFASAQKLNKIELDKKWARLNSRLGPIISSSVSVPSPPSSTSSSFPPASTQAAKSALETDDSNLTLNSNELVDFIESNLSKNMAGRSLLLARILLAHPEIKISKKRIYVNDQALPSSTVNILRHLIGRFNRLHYDLTPLLFVLSQDYNDQLLRLIQNKEFRDLLKNPSAPLLSSTPKRKKNKAEEDEKEDMFTEDNGHSEFMTDDLSDDEANNTPLQGTMNLALAKQKKGSGQRATRTTRFRWLDLL